jgi:hypothetical protein
LVQKPAPYPTQAFGVADAEYFTHPSGRMRSPPITPSLR